MIKIQDVVRSIVFEHEEALTVLAQDFMNLSGYATLIQAEVAERCLKPVGRPSIVVALSRLQKQLKGTHPLVQPIVIEAVTTKSPLTEIALAKTPHLLSRLSSLYDTVGTRSDDFLTMTLGTAEVTVICSDRIKPTVLKHLGGKPLLITANLAAIGLTLDPKYYDMPNITWSLLRRIALKRIPLAETITTHREIIFVFDRRHLSELVGLF